MRPPSLPAPSQTPPCSSLPCYVPASVASSQQSMGEARSDGGHCLCVCLCNGVKWACLGREICLPDTRRPRKDRGNCPIAGSPTVTAVKSVTTRGIHKLFGLYRSSMTDGHLICSLYNLQCCKMPNVEGKLLIRRKFRITHTHTHSLCHIHK